MAASESSSNDQNLHTHGGNLGRDTSVDGVSVALTSPSSSFMFQSNLDEIKSRFADLLSCIKSALKANHVSVDGVHGILVEISNCRSNLVPNTDLDELFRAASDHNLWRYDHYSPVERIVRRFIYDHLCFVSEYKKFLSGFLATARLIDFISHTNLSNSQRGASELPLQSYNMEYDTLATKLNTDRNITMLSLMYVQDLWNSFADEFRIPSLTAVVEEVLEGCLEITWRISPSAAKLITDGAQDAIPFFRKHDIIYVSISGRMVYDVRQIESAHPSTLEVTGYHIDSGVHHTEQTSFMEVSPMQTELPQALEENSTSFASGSQLLTTVGQLEMRFSQLLDLTKAELAHMNKPVDIVYRLLTNLTDKRFQKYILDLRSGPPSNLDELLDDLNSYRSNSLEYELLHEVIRRNGCSAGLRKKMEQYVHDINKFKRNPTLSRLTAHKDRILKRKKSRLKGYHNKLKTIHNIDPEKATYLTVDHFHQELKALSKRSLDLLNMEIGSVMLEWTVLDEDVYAIVELFCSQEGKDLLQRHHVSDVSMNDAPINQSLLLITAASHGKWDKVSTLLQDKLEDVDINYSNSKNGQTALHCAASVKEEQCVEIVKTLLKEGADPNIQDIDGWTPLMKAVKSGHEESIRLLFRTHNPIICQLSLQDIAHGWTALHIAVIEGRLDAVSLLLDHATQEDLTLIDKGGRTALHHAAINGMIEVVGKMLERGADANIQDTEGQTPLMAAVRGQHTETVEAFLLRNPDLSIQDKNNLWSVLHMAADMNLAEILELLVQSTDEAIFNLRDKGGKTALEIAEAKGHAQIVEILKTAIESELEEEARTTSEGDIAAKEEESEPSASGGDLEEKETSGMFGKVKDWFRRNTKEIRLNRAAVRGSVADVQKALDGKANPNGITNKLTLRTPLMEASERGHTEVVKCLLSNGADPTMIAADNRTALIMASKGGYVDTVEAILTAKLPPETLNAAAGFWKWTALHTVAFYRGYNKQFTKDEYRERMRRITGILIEAGADPFAEDRTGDTALSLASYKGYTDIVKEILEKTPSERRKELIDHQRNDQWSALLLAARHGRHEVVRILLDAGASMTVSNKANMTALHLSIRSTDEETVKTLASEADPSAINAIDNHGYTPLIIATKLKNLKLVEVLVDAGADVNLQASKEKKTALMYAAKLNSVSIVTRLVEEYKADLSLKDDKQQSARTYAGDKKVQKLIDRLLKEKEQREKVQGESEHITSEVTVV